jgi:hypothetical protein
VNASKYDETTWELATRIDTWNQAITYGAWLLEWALEEPSAPPRKAGGKAKRRSFDADAEYVNATAALEALYVLEEGLHMQAGHNHSAAASTLKNIVSGWVGGGACVCGGLLAPWGLDMCLVEHFRQHPAPFLLRLQHRDALAVHLGTGGFFRFSCAGSWLFAPRAQQATACAATKPRRVAAVASTPALTGDVC